MFNGILLIRKESGFTSHDVVAKLRGICRQKKIGHTGTLDPNATGVLPLCLGNATKLCGMLTEQTKEYVAEMILGKTTDTQDIWGKELSESGDSWRKLSENRIRESVLSFQGRQLQTPPMYSARKINGKKLYELARAGIEVERKPAEIEIKEIELLTPEKEADIFSALPKLYLRIVCSKGTYIRTICHDIGEKLGCGAVMSSLVRTRAGAFRLEEAYTLNEAEELFEEGILESALIPVDQCFREYPAVQVSGAGMRFLKNGNELPLSMLERMEALSGLTDEKEAFGLPAKKNVSEGLFVGKEGLSGLQEGTLLRVYGTEMAFYGVYCLQKEKGRLCPCKMFLPKE